MKKIFFVLMCSVLVAAAYAQTHADLGIKGGINIANLKIESSSNPDAKVGFHAGVLAHLHFSTNWAVQPEVVFSTQGAKQTIAGVDYKTKLSYVNIPVLLQYMTGTGFRFQTGPQLGVLVSAEQEVGDNEENIKESIKTIEIGWPIGASYVTKSGFGADVRYNIGLTNINDESSDNTIKNRVWQLGVFYQFQVTQMGQKHIK